MSTAYTPSLTRAIFPTLDQSSPTSVIFQDLWQPSACKSIFVWVRVHQYRIAKKEEDGRTQTEVLLLDYEERIGELARIMGGLQVTDTVRKAAEELLKGAVT